jgi:hypothetical protein
VLSPRNTTTLTVTLTSLSLDELAIQFPLYYEALTNSTKRDPKVDLEMDLKTDPKVDPKTDPKTGSKTGSKTNNITNSTGSISSEQRCFQVTIKAGEMLFIPAGWFHEVRLEYLD